MYRTCLPLASNQPGLAVSQPYTPAVSNQPSQLYRTNPASCIEMPHQIGRLYRTNLPSCIEPTLPAVSNQPFQLYRTNPASRIELILSAVSNQPCSCIKMFTSDSVYHSQPRPAMLEQKSNYSSINVANTIVFLGGMRHNEMNTTNCQRSSWAL